VAIVTPDYPDTSALPAGIMHVVGDKHYRKWAYFNCPCGCGTPIMLSLSAARRPHWRVDIDWLDRPSVEPSVWQTEGCCSHFFVRRGSIQWVGNGAPPPVTASPTTNRPAAR
jgi:Family of unknown function (DUF6527)